MASAIFGDICLKGIHRVPLHLAISRSIGTARCRVAGKFLVEMHNLRTPRPSLARARASAWGDRYMPSARGICFRLAQHVVGKTNIEIMILGSSIFLNLGRNICIWAEISKIWGYVWGLHIPATAGKSAASGVPALEASIRHTFEPGEARREGGPYIQTCLICHVVAKEGALAVDVSSSLSKYP